MPSRIADRLLRARERQMVGREAEINLFCAALDAEEPPFLLLYLHGPGGVGKSTLLQAFQGCCKARNLPVTLLDARNFEPSRDAFRLALGAALGLSPGEDAVTALAEGEGRRVLLLDTYENLAPLDGWFRDVFVPQLSADTLIVVTDTQPPSTGWRTDPGWQDLLQVMSLRNFSPEESAHYLEMRGVPPVHHRAALDFTHGFPLALSLITDVFTQRGGSAAALRFDPETTPDVVQALLSRFVEKVPSPAHRAALEASALVRLTTEPLLAEMLIGTEAAGGKDSNFDPHELFQWLRSLSFMEATWQGLYPHDVAREALLAELRWRNRDRYAELHRRARSYYSSRLEEAQGLDQQRVLFDYIFLHRDNAVVRSSFDWRESAAVAADTLNECDLAPLVSLVAKYEGPESARLAERWLRAQPENAIVFRDGSEIPAGFLMMVALHRASPEERESDPATDVAWRYLEKHAPLRPGEGATHFRFWLARDTYHAISPVQSQIIVNVVRHYLTHRGLSYSFFPVSSPEFWAKMFSYVELHRLPEADYALDGRSWGCFTHDWREMPPTDWLSCLAEKEIAAGRQAQLPAPTRRPSLIVLSEEDFAAAVRGALRILSDPGALRNSPLLRSRMVSERVSSDDHAQEPIAARVLTLRSLLQEAIESLQNHPRKARGYRPLNLTYVRPGLSQERVSEMLDLPFSTYRRHLTEGIQEVTQYLWRREIGDPEREEDKWLSSK